MTIKDPEAITIDGRTLVSRTHEQVEGLIDILHSTPSTKGTLVKARGGDGVGSLGMYVEAVQRNSIQRHVRYFVYGPHVYAAARVAGQSKATWRGRSYGTTFDALQTVEKLLNAPGTEVFGRVVLVEMSADDISAVESGQVPPARFKGQYRVEKDFGKFDFARLEPGKPLPCRDLPDRLVKAAGGISA
jgi:hypothetical protein